MNILIVGYGNIGRHMFKEFKQLQPDIYDPFIAEYSVKQSKRYDFAFICVPTDSLPDGGCDTSIVEQAVAETNAEIIVIKSTVPPGTTDRLIGALRHGDGVCAGGKVSRACAGKQIIFSPEHYGVTQHCKTDPGFVILGGKKELTAKVAELYATVKNGYYQIRFTDAKTAELSKYMLNSYLALKVTFCNEFADLANKFGVSYPELRELFVLDERVGASHTFVYSDKPFYDSHCFNKDVPALVQFADGQAPLISAMNDINLARKGIRPLQKYASEIVQRKPETEPAKIILGSAGFESSCSAEIAESTAMEQSANEKTPRKNKSVPSHLIETSLQKFRPAQTSFQYDCSVCLIIRDENEYLEEWLRWHIGQGVQHFYIYDHDSKEPVSEFVRNLDLEISSKVTVVDWSGMHEHAQSEAYNDCLKRFGGQNKWIGFIDADEQVRVKTGQSLPEFLRNYEEFAGLLVIWHMYDADGQAKKTSAPLRERFKRINECDRWANKAGKVFVQPPRMKDMFIHNGHTQPDFYIVGERKDMIPDFSMINENATTDLICIDHYYTKSYEEWLEKLRRGSADSNYSRKYKEFFEYNPDLEYCREEEFPRQEYEVSTKHPKIQGKYYVCAIVKDEHEYIREWALHNRSLGFDKIFLYDNNGSKPYDTVLGDLIAEGFVEVREWGDTRWTRQVNAYNRFIQSGAWGEEDWCAFIDPDEFLHFDKAENIEEFVKLYENFSGVGLSWRMYNANGRIEQPPKEIPTAEAYTTEFEYWEPRIKVIGRLINIDHMFSPHAFMPKADCPPLVTTGREIILGQHPHYKDFTNGHIKHFMTKSWQDWVKRLKRGNITKGLRKINTFFEFNPDMKHLKEELVKDLNYDEFPTIKHTHEKWDFDIQRK